MKLLLDQNLSSHIIHQLSDIFITIEHVRNIGLDAVNDIEIWNYAKDNNFTIVTKDSDFYQFSSVYGYPPKIIWLKLGNCSTKIITEILRRHFNDINSFCNDNENSYLILTKTYFN